MVYFAHRQESGHWGTKIKSLAKVATSQGFTIESPDYSGIMNPDQRVSKLLDLNPKSSRKLILAGSSTGAWVSLKASGIIFPERLFHSLQQSTSENTVRRHPYQRHGPAVSSMDETMM